MDLRFYYLEWKGMEKKLSLRYEVKRTDVASE